MKNKFLLSTIALFVCAQALWAQPELVVQEWHRVWRKDERPQALYGHKQRLKTLGRPDWLADKDLFKRRD